MRHRTDAEDPPVELFTEDVDRDIARLHNSRHDGTLDWDQYLEVPPLYHSLIVPIQSRRRFRPDKSHTHTHSGELFRDSIWTIRRVGRACSR
jgi:hypothetical protein